MWIKTHNKEWWINEIIMKIRENYEIGEENDGSCVIQRSDYVVLWTLYIKSFTSCKLLCKNNCGVARKDVN